MGPGMTHVNEAPATRKDGDEAELRRRSFSGRTIVLQSLGLLVGVGLLAWVVSIALSPEHRGMLAALRSPPPWTIGVLGATSGASIVLNGLIFWQAARPIRRLPALHVVGVNAIATTLSPLPFKLGFLTRCVIHMRRDGLRLADLFAWFAGVAAVALAVIVPVACAGLWRRQVDGWWLAVVAAGPLACAGAGVLVGRAAEGRPWLRRLSLGSWRSVREPGPVFAQVVLRIADLGVHSVRFHAAGAVAGVDLDPSQAALFGTTYFLLTAIAPAGTLGFTEMGTAGVAALVGTDPGQVGLIALIVTLAQTGTALALGIVSSAWVRPDRVLLGWKNDRKESPR